MDIRRSRIFQDTGRRGSCIISDPLPEEAQSQPLGISVPGSHALASSSGEVQPEEFRLCTELRIFKVIEFVFDEIDDRVRYAGCAALQLKLACECRSEDYFL